MLDGTVDGKAAHLTDWSGTLPLPMPSLDALRHTGAWRWSQPLRATERTREGCLEAHESALFPE
jgi:hypothetical protein